MLDTDDGCIVYNTLTKSLILIEGFKSGSAKNLPDHQYCEELTSYSMLIDESYDEYLRLCKLKELLSKNKIINTPQRKLYSIFTTLGCNARCYYCFENGLKRTDMGMDTAIATANYIINKNKGEKVTLKWFGGEPLFNKKVIDLIVKKLKDGNVEFDSIMFSNGYLFDIETIRKAFFEWKLQKITITLDGTEETYNRTKAYKNAEESPYKRVLRNIGLLLEMKIKVSIRLNLSLENSDDLLRLVEELLEIFKGYDNISFETYLLYEYNKRNHQGIIYDLLGKYKRVKDKFKQFGINSEGLYKDTSILQNCMAESDNSIVILPDGKLSKCQHYITNNLIGDIWKGITDQETVRRFKEREYHEGRCEKCLFAPTCTQLKMCPINCTDLNIEIKKIDLEYQMLAEYERWKKERQNV